jgi:aminopeptidase
MNDVRVEKLADLLVNYSVKVKPGDNVAIQGEILAEPLHKAVLVKVLQAGGNPFLLVSPNGINELYYRYASDEQIKHIPPPAELMNETYDVFIYIKGEENTRALANVNPARIVARQQSRAGLWTSFLKRAARGRVRWVYTLYPVNAFAQDAEMSLTEYEDFIYTACLGNLDDPKEYWKWISARQQKIIDWLKGRNNIHVTAPETELDFSIADRAFISCDGHENMPDGEVYTGPVEDSLFGNVCFSYPAIINGHEVSGVRLHFENGRVVKATAEKNENLLLKILDTDEGARRVGEFAFGMNQGITGITKQILFDEKIGGSFHIALGSSYPQTGGKNISAIHWDMICDMRQGGEVIVDGQRLYKDGQFVIPLD